MVSPIKVLKLRKENNELKEKLKETQDLKSQYLDMLQDVKTYIYDLKLENFELKGTLAQRDAEINALKHMLDRKDEEQ